MSSDPVISLSRAQARRSIFVGQGLPGRHTSAAAAVAEGGFVRTLGGIDVYLGVAARVAGLRRDELGHGRSFSLDTDDDLRRRSAQLRRLVAA